MENVRILRESRNARGGLREARDAHRRDGTRSGSLYRMSLLLQELGNEREPSPP
jgi:hypothetical protein